MARSPSSNGRASAPVPRALDPTRQIIKIARSDIPGNTPVGLEIGELGIDIAASPRLWVGCLPAIDASGLLRLHVADPAASFLPLTGGTLTGPGNLTLDGGNLTLDGGTLTVSGATPTVTWDVTGANPFRWSVGYWPSIQDFQIWSVTAEGAQRFSVQRAPGPSPGYYLTHFLTDEVFAHHRLRVGSFLSVVQDSYFGGHISIHSTGQPDHGGRVRLSRIDPVAAATVSTHLGSIEFSGIPGDDTWDPSTLSLMRGEVLGGQIRFNATKEWTRYRDLDPNPPHALLSQTIELGSEINFFVSRTGGPTTYRAMTLEQDGNLSLPHAVPSAAEHVVTLGYLTGASTGFLPLTGGILTGPGNLAVNGTLAVSNSDTVSATITNTGSGATGLKIVMNGSGGTGLDIERPFQAGVVLRARGEAFIGPSNGTTWNFSSSLIGDTANTGSNLIHLTGTGGGIFMYAERGGAADPAGVYALGISRNSTPDNRPFIQFFDASGYGFPISSTPGRVIGSIWFGGYNGTSAVTPFHPHVLKSAAIYAEPTETWSGTANGSRIVFQTTPNGTTTAQTALIVENDLNVTVTGTVTASGSLLTSDPALKEISPAPADALAKVCELPVIDFRWKHGRDSKMHRGFSAVDIARVMGEDSGCSAEGAYSLADMNAVLWQAVQELSAQVQDLTMEVRNGTKPRRSH